VPVKNICGSVFGRLAVIRLYDTRGGYARWVCRCICGQTTIVLGTHLRQGNTQSCGCLQKDVAAAGCRKHGLWSCATYVAWQNMIRRCVPGTKYYDRGIEVCVHWKASFLSFLAEMGDRPGSGYSLERIDPDGNYYAENCEWIPKAENTIDTYRGKLTKRGRKKKQRVATT